MNWSGNKWRFIGLNQAILALAMGGSCEEIEAERRRPDQSRGSLVADQRAFAGPGAATDLS